ncbi:MAG: uncharacterized protein A8A55_3222, partial [Amphiamblys sp. WSBS2006]
MKQIYSNIETMPKNCIQFDAREIHAVENGICVLLKLFDGVDEHVPDLLLESSTKEHIEEILETESHLAWIGRAKNLSLTGRAIEILPALGLHEESKIEDISLRAYDPAHVAEILRMENNSVGAGCVKRLNLYEHAVGILPKICFHEESEMESLVLYSDFHDSIAEISKMENNSIWVGKVRVMGLGGYAVGIFSKLGIHEEFVMEELLFSAVLSEYITEMLEKENSSICVGRVKVLGLVGYAVGILPKLGIHRENVMEVFGLDTDKTEHLTEIFKAESNSIWVGKVKKLVLRYSAVGIFPKLKLHQENMMELFLLNVEIPGYIAGILKEENNSIWI